MYLVEPRAIRSFPQAGARFEVQVRDGVCAYAHPHTPGQDRFTGSDAHDRTGSSPYAVAGLPGHAVDALALRFIPARQGGT